MILRRLIHCDDQKKSVFPLRTHDLVRSVPGYFLLIMIRVAMDEFPESLD